MNLVLNQKNGQTSPGDHHAYLEPGKEEDLNGFDRVIYVPTAKEKPLEVLCHGLGLIQKAQRADATPEVWFVLRGTQAELARKFGFSMVFQC